MDGAGFKVKLSGRSLASGECRIKRETARIVFGENLVPSERANEVSLTLTDAADSSRWQASLRACEHDNKYCWLSGLRVWMQHKRARVDDKLYVDREAQGALYLRLDPGASGITDAPSSSHARTAEAHGAAGPAQHASSPPPPTVHTKTEGNGRPPGVVAASDSGQLPAAAPAHAAAPLRRAGVGGRGWERVDPAAAAHRSFKGSGLPDTAAPGPQTPQYRCIQQQEGQRVGGGPAKAPNYGRHPGAGSHGAWAGVEVKVEQEDGHAVGLEQQQGVVAVEQQGLWTFGQHDQDPLGVEHEQQHGRQQKQPQWQGQGQEGRLGQERQGQQGREQRGQGFAQCPDVKREGPGPWPTGAEVAGTMAGAAAVRGGVQQDTPAFYDPSIPAAGPPGAAYSQPCGPCRLGGPGGTERREGEQGTAQPVDAPQLGSTQEEQQQPPGQRGPPPSGDIPCSRGRTCSDAEATAVEGPSGTAAEGRDGAVLLKYSGYHLELPAAAKGWFPAVQGTGAGPQAVQVYGRCAAAASGSGDAGQLQTFEVSVVHRRSGSSCLCGVAALVRWLGLGRTGWVRLQRCSLQGMGQGQGPVIVAERAEEEWAQGADAAGVTDRREPYSTRPRAGVTGDPGRGGAAVQEVAVLVAQPPGSLEAQAAEQRRSPREQESSLGAIAGVESTRQCATEQDDALDGMPLSKRRRLLGVRREGGEGASGVAKQGQEAHAARQPPVDVNGPAAAPAAAPEHPPTALSGSAPAPLPAPAPIPAPAAVAGLIGRAQGFAVAPGAATGPWQAAQYTPDPGPSDVVPQAAPKQAAESAPRPVPSEDCVAPQETSSRNQHYRQQQQHSVALVLPPLPVSPPPPPPPPQQHLCVASVNPAHLPAASLTAAHLPGHMPPATGPPPLQPGELRLCGLTFHPHLAPGMQEAIAAWVEGLGATPLEELDPSTEQVQVLGVGSGSGRGSGAGTGVAGASDLAAAAECTEALVKGHGLSPAVLAARVAKLLGLANVEAWGRALPEEAPVQEAWLERRRDEQRGGWGLWAKGAVKKSHPLYVVGGYVMPAGVGSRFVASGLRHCPEEVRGELRGRVSNGDGEEDEDNLLTRVPYGWKMLAASYSMPYLGGGATGGTGSGADSSCRPVGAAPAPAPVLCLLGYGSLAALANDPRVNPRAWQEGHDVGATHEQLQPNCGIVYVSVRGLALPVLVALRDIAPGEQLLRDYGATWWRDIAPVWEVAEDAGLEVQRLFGAGQEGRSSGGGGTGPCSATQLALPPDVGAAQPQLQNGQHQALLLLPPPPAQLALPQPPTQREQLQPWPPSPAPQNSDSGPYESPPAAALVPQHLPDPETESMLDPDAIHLTPSALAPGGDSDGASGRMGARETPHEPPPGGWQQARRRWWRGNPPSPNVWTLVPENGGRCYADDGRLWDPINRRFCDDSRSPSPRRARAREPWRARRGLSRSRSRSRSRSGGRGEEAGRGRSRERGWGADRGPEDAGDEGRGRGRVRVWREVGDTSAAAAAGGLGWHVPVCDSEPRDVGDGPGGEARGRNRSRSRSLSAGGGEDGARGTCAAHSCGTGHEQGRSSGAVVRSQSRSPTPRRGMCLSQSVGTPASSSGGLLQLPAPAVVPAGKPQLSTYVSVGAGPGGGQNVQAVGAGADVERSCGVGNSGSDAGAVGDRGATGGKAAAEPAGAGAQARDGIAGCEAKANAKDTSALAVLCPASTAPLLAPSREQQEGSGGSSAKEEVNTPAVAVEQGQEVGMGPLAGDASRPPLRSPPPSPLSPAPHPGPRPLPSPNQQDRPAFQFEGPTCLPLTVLLPFAPAWLRLLPDNRSKEPSEVAAAVAAACTCSPVCDSSAEASAPALERLADALAKVLGMEADAQSRLASRLVLLGTAAVVATQELVLRRGWALEPEGSVLRLVLWPGTGPGGQDGAGGVDGTLERRCGRTRWTAGGTAPPVTVVPGLQLRIRRPPSKATAARFQSWHKLKVTMDFTEMLRVLRTGSKADLHVLKTWTEQVTEQVTDRKAAFVFMAEMEQQWRQQEQQDQWGTGGRATVQQQQQQQQPGNQGDGFAELQDGSKQEQHPGQPGGGGGGPTATAQPGVQQVVQPLQWLHRVPLDPEGFMTRCRSLQSHLLSTSTAKAVTEAQGRPGTVDTAALKEKEQQQQPAPKRAKRGQGQKKKMKKKNKAKTHQHQQQEQLGAGVAQQPGGQGVHLGAGGADVPPDVAQRGHTQKKQKQEQQSKPKTHRHPQELQQEQQQPPPPPQRQEGQQQQEQERQQRPRQEQGQQHRYQQQQRVGEVQRPVTMQQGGMPGAAPGTGFTMGSGYGPTAAAAYGYGYPTGHGAQHALQVPWQFRRAEEIAAIMRSLFNPLGAWR